jgi:hypothetical protein
MNRTERLFYEQHIEPLVTTGVITHWWYERWRFTLTEPVEGKPGIAYTPDFVVRFDTGELLAYEVKGCGNARRESLNRTKLFSDQTGIRTMVATQKPASTGGGFSLEEY